MALDVAIPVVDPYGSGFRLLRWVALPFSLAVISGEITRRYHSFLIAALPAPQGRIRKTASG